MAYLGSTTLKDVLGALWSGGHIPNGARDILNSQGGKDKPGYRHPLVRETPGILKTGSYQEGCAYLALKIAEALAYAHEKGVLHLDLKPSNVLVDAGGCPRLLDFNLATAASRGAPRMGGTPVYMSPEQALCFIGLTDPASLDERSDIYSLGVMLYELLCGRLPPECSSRALATQDGSSVAPQQAPVELVPRWQAHTVCKSLRGIVDRCLAVERDDRFASMADLVKSLRCELSLNRRIEHWLAIRRRSVTATAGVALLCLTGIAAGLAYRAPYDVREYQLGLNCLTSEQHQQAIEHFTCSLDHRPDNPDVYYARARSYMATDDFHSAIRDLVAADRLRRTGIQCALLGYCCSRIQEPGEAVSWYDRAISLGNTDPAVYLNLGFAHHLRSRHDSAVIALNKALEGGANRGVVLRNRAIVHYTMALSENREPTEARSDIEAAIASGQVSGHTYFRAAKIYAFACVHDKKWENDALRCIQLALQNGIPLQYIKSDRYLKSIFEASTLSASLWPNAREQVDLVADCLVCPRY
jgi:Flp pilus assembly protein TadD